MGKRLCVVCAEEPQTYGLYNLCEGCFENGRLLVTAENYTAFQWAAERARDFERRRQRKGPRP